MPKANKVFDVAVVGSGPAGSIAAATLARGGASVALIDKSKFPRPKACGDLVGPRAIALCDQLGLALPKDKKVVTDMILVGPNGNSLRLPAESGTNYPGVGWLITRNQFDAYLHTFACNSGALPIHDRTSAVAPTEDGFTITLTNKSIRAKSIIGADGATSLVAKSLGMSDDKKALYGFAIRGYLKESIETPIISLFKNNGNFFPGYGWIFSDANGYANIGVGVGVLSNRRIASVATNTLDPYLEILRGQGYVSSSDRAIEQTLGGWLKMGGQGCTPVKGRALLVGDAAGLVNPLQGEGIFAAMDSGYNAAKALLENPATASQTYLHYLTNNYLRFQSTTATLQAIVLKYPKLGELAANALTSPLLPKIIGSAWGIYWNDLLRGSENIKGATLARAIDSLAFNATKRSHRYFDLAEAYSQANTVK